MKLFSTLLLVFLCFQLSFSQSTWSPGSSISSTNFGISSYYNNGFPSSHLRIMSPERIALMKKYKAEYKGAFSGSLSLGYNQLSGDLSGQSSDIFPQLNLTATINKRSTPLFSWKAVASIGSYQAQGYHANPNIYTGDTPSPFPSGDFNNSEVKGSWSSIALMTRRKISFSRIRSINDERKFGCFFSWGVGYLSSHVLLVSLNDVDARISRTISSITIPIMLDFSCLIKNNLGAMASFDMYLFETDNLDLIRSDIPDFMTNIRAGLFYKIDN